MPNFLYKSVIILTVNLFITYLSNASDTLSLRFNGGAGYLWSQDDPGFDRFRGMRDCCEGYELSDGTGINVHIATGLEFYFLSLDFGASYVSINTAFYGEDIDPVLDVEKNESVNGIFGHNLGSQRYILQPFARLGIHPFRGFRVDGTFGINLFNTVADSEYDYIETIVSPENGVFEPDRTRTRNPQQGVIEGMAENMFFSAALSYELPLSSTVPIYLVPRLEYTQFIGSQLEYAKWDTETFSAGLGITYKLYLDLSPSIKATFDTIIDIDTLELIDYTRFADQYSMGKILISEDSVYSKENHESLKTTYIERTDTIFLQPDRQLLLESDTKSITANLEFISQSIPLLPYFFFKGNSTELIDDIQFTEVDLEMNNHAGKTNIDYYKVMPSILAIRLKKFPDAIVKITGFIDPETEKDCMLAISRAEATKKMFTENYGIDGSRLIIVDNSGSCYPSNISSVKSEIAFAEHRRVELHSNDPKIFENFQIESSPIIKSLMPNSLDIYTTISDDTGIQSDNLKDALKMGSLISPVLKFTSGIANKTFSVNRNNIISDTKSKFDLTTNGQTFVIGHNATNNSLSIDGLPNSIDIDFRVSSDYLDFEKASTSLPIAYDTLSINKFKLNLVLFELGSIELNESGRNELKKFASRLKQNPEISIKGFADDLGEVIVNRKLAEGRAKAAKAYLEYLRPDAVIELKSYNDGERPVGIQSFDTPVERLFSRTVEIEANFER
ncbi:MAG: hypothetical protein Kapaf2KO_16450 [Candidatus Kapaibacteriales bacterium]